MNDESIPNCPECELPLESPFSSCRCGWRVKHAKTAAAVEDRQCTGMDGAVRCERQGWLSHGTRGGPWQCDKHHYVSVEPIDKGSQAAREGMAAIRDLVKAKTQWPGDKQGGSSA